MLKPDTFELQLTLEDFLNAKEYANPFDCPVSTGLKRLFPGYVGSSLHSCTLHYTEYKEVTQYLCADIIIPLIDAVKAGNKPEFPKLIFRKI